MLFAQNVAAQTLVIPMIKTLSPVRSVSWNKNGTTFAYAEDKNIFVRDSSGYMLLQSIETPNDPINFLQFTQNTEGDGLNQMAALSEDRYLSFWILPQTAPVHVSREESEAAPTALAYNINGNYIATGNSDGLIKVYMQNYLTNAFISRTFGELGSPIYSLNFSQDNKYLISGSADDSACIWNVASGKLIKAFPYYSESKVPVLISRDSLHVCMATSPNTIGIFDLEFQKLREIRTEAEIKSIRLSSDESKLIILTEDNIFHFYDIFTADITNYIPAYNESPITAFAFNNVTTKVVICHEDGSLYVLNLEDVLFSPDEKPQTYSAVIGEEKESGEVGEYEKVEDPEEKVEEERAAIKPKEEKEKREKKEVLPDEEEDVEKFYKDGHGIIINFGVSMLPSPFTVDIHLPIGYRNYGLLTPFYFGGFMDLLLGFPGSDYPYSYNFNGETMASPVMLGARLYAPFGICIYPLRNDFEIFAEVFPGIAFTKLWNGRFDSYSAASKFFPSFFTGLKVGVAWDFMNLAIGGTYDAMFGFSFSVEAGVVLNLGGSRTIWGKKRK